VVDLAVMTTRADPIQLTTQLMSIDSTSGREGDVIAWLDSHLVHMGWHTRRIPVSAGRDDLYASMSDSPVITLTTHLDTVPPFIPPRVDDGHIRGRGACGTKGAVRVIVRTKGQAAHSAYPHLGQSATRDLVRLLAELDAMDLPTDELLGNTTINIGSLSGGVADNVVAPSAEARLMIRLVTPAEDVMSRIEAWAKGRASLEWGPMVPPMKLGVVDGFQTSVAAFATDIPALTNWGTPYLFGPGSIHVAHRDDECLRIDELHRAVDAYEHIVRQVLTRLPALPT
jgi:acetylornithine deacetylase/succinyl-diaminopimelate desuccinylase-like protein